MNLKLGIIFRLIGTKLSYYLTTLQNELQQTNENTITNSLDNIIKFCIDNVNMIIICNEIPQSVNIQSSLLFLRTIPHMDRIKLALPSKLPMKPVLTLRDGLHQLSSLTNLLTRFTSTLHPLPPLINQFTQYSPPPLRVAQSGSRKLTNQRMTQSTLGGGSNMVHNQFLLSIIPP